MYTNNKHHKATGDLYHEGIDNTYEEIFLLVKNYTLIAISMYTNTCGVAKAGIKLKKIKEGITNKFKK